MAYAIVLGEALVDLYQAECDGEVVFRPMVGGAPLNVACGLARLGTQVEFIAGISTDTLGERILDVLSGAGVGTSRCVRVDVPTALAVTSLSGAEPQFTFYGSPPSYALIGPEHVDTALVANAAALYCGSIALLEPGSLAAASAAWAVPGPLRTLDPNVRPALLKDPAGLRRVVEEFAATADLVKLSEPDAKLLFGLTPGSAARHLLGLGARAVVVTLGARGAFARTRDVSVAVPAPPVDAIDATGAGDAAMAALIFGLMEGIPVNRDEWLDLMGLAVRAGSLATATRGGATAMPPLSQLRP